MLIHRAHKKMHPHSQNVLTAQAQHALKLVHTGKIPFLPFDVRRAYGL